MHYYGTRLSENISRRPEGYLLCLNVPVARSGTQEYLPEELGVSAPSPGPPAIPVYRPEEEVFSPETIASFEGMPVTNDHPPDGVSIDNIRALQKGHAQNVRRGTGEDADLLLADLMITDSYLIHLILEEGKREISCGYTYELCQEDDRFIQRKIRGNHIAVVDAGRAGPRVSIKDSDPADAALQRPARPSRRIIRLNHSNTDHSERRPIKMKKSLYRKLLRMARDGDPEAIEAIAEVAEALLEPDTPDVNVTVVNTEPAAPPVVPVAAAAAAPAPSEGTTLSPQAAVPAAPAPAVADPAATITTPEGNEVVVDGDTLTEILYRLDRLIDLLSPANPPLAVNTPAPADCGTPAANSDDEPEKEIAEIVEEAMEAITASAENAPADPAEALSALVEEVLEPAPEDLESILSSVLEPGAEEKEETSGLSRDVLRCALKSVSPRLQKISQAGRDKVCVDLAKRIKKLPKGAVYRDMYTSQKKAVDSPTVDLGKKIMASRNPNYKA